MLNNLKHFFYIFIVLCVFVLGLNVYAVHNHLVIVYPRDGAVITANSTFFIGNTNPKATLTINNKPVKVYSNGAFVRVFDLKQGENLITLKSNFQNDLKEKNLRIFVKPAQASGNNENINKFYPLKKKLIVNEETPLRQTPYGNRLTPVKKGVIFEAIGVQNNHYKIELDKDKFAYILKSATHNYSKNYIKNQILDKIFFTEDAKNIIIKIPLKQFELVELEQKDNKLSVKINNAQLTFNDYIVKSPYIKNFEFNNNRFVVELLSNGFYGYDYFYEQGCLVLKIRKPFSKGLRGKIIAIDAGHGGKELGSVGPTQVPEKDINLAIALYLKNILEKKGAIVVLTREEDNFVGLYKRVEIANAHDADILISIHNNALPDGQNPYVIHGTSTYYYHEQALDLANIVQNELLKATGFINHGVKHGSLVLTRPSMPMSILVEVGFMINPFEYEQLLVPNNQKAYAMAICDGLRKYFDFE